MNGPYWMFGGSVIASLTLILFLIFYSCVFPRKKINYPVILILISILPILSIFRIGSYESGDLSIHTAYSMSFFESLKEGILIPNWAEHFNNGFGYPLFGFSYLLPYYISSFFHILGFNFILSTKLVLAFSFIASGVFMYLYIKEELKKEYLAFAAAILYLFAPYHLIDLHFRVDIGETLALVFIPLVFLFANKIIKKPTPLWVFLEAISICFLVLSHQAISLSVIPFLAIYALIHNKNIVPFVFSFISGLLLSSFYWLPVIAEKQFTHPSIDVVNFPPISLFLFSPWRYGFLYQGPGGELSFPIGYVHILLLGLLVFLLISKRIAKTDMRLAVFFLISTLISFFMATELSKPIWDTAPLISNFQFSYRMMGAASFFAAVCCAVSLKYIPAKFIVILICLTAAGITILNWGNRRMLPDVNSDQVFHSIINDRVGLTPALPVWTPEWKEKKREKGLDVISGSADVKEIMRTSTVHKYEVVANEDVNLLENSSYFPGWNVYVDGREAKIEYTSEKYPGLITLRVEEGKHEVLAEFKDTSIRRVGKVISAIASVLLLGVLVKGLNLPKLKV